MTILKKVKDKCVTLYQKMKNRVENAKERAIKGVAIAIVLMLPFSAYAADDGASTLTQLGDKVANLIALFAGIVTAIGMASITIIVLIQGFKMAWGMVRTIK